MACTFGNKKIVALFEHAICQVLRSLQTCRKAKTPHQCRCNNLFLFVLNNDLINDLMYVRNVCFECMFYVYVLYVCFKCMF